MFIFFILFSSVLSHDTTQIEELYLIQPYVNAKGDSKLVNLQGDYSIVSHGGDQHIKLSHMSKDTRGALVYKQHINKDRFQVEFKIAMEDLKVGEEGSGMLIFFSDTENIELGAFYGIKTGFEGLCIAFDISEGYEVNVMVATGKINAVPGMNNKMFSTKNHYTFYDNDQVSVKVIQSDEGLRVVLFDDYEELEAFKSKGYFINKKSFIGVSACNGSKSEASFTVRSIEPSALTQIPVYFEKGERESSSKIIWVVFLMGACGIVYYLYDTQIKKAL
ncbi:hypothetical protein P3W45_000763 [Vairimorpha bombi]|jgi:hypothetical protein